MANKIEIELVKSSIGKSQKQKDTLRGLGLTKMRKRVVLTDTLAIWGMIHKVAHLVEVKS